MIRPATDQDVPAIAALWNHMIRETSHTFTTVERSVPEVANLISAQQTCLVLEQAGHVGGFARFGPFRPGPGYRFTAEHSIILSETAQGDGQGRELMRGLCDLARQQGLQTLIGAISGENLGAIAFHRAIGFEKVAVLSQVGFKFGRRIDLVLMQKML
ncbi:N-acetyltransferase family protein [Yoonia sp. SS1-5]|uniref:N-acetyltransferase family protein n=1 Tax=Yoonia rhodophyticola TaxID=3137370 RepID=A0AAN0NKI2_9RHOB